MALIDAFLYSLGLSFSSAFQAWFGVAVFLVFLQGRVYILRLNIDDVKSSLNSLQLNESPVVLYKQKHNGHKALT